MTLFQVVYALLAAYLLVGWFAGHRSWRIIQKANKRYQEKIRIHIEVGMRMGFVSNESVRRLWQLQEEQQDLLNILNQKNAYRIVVMVYLVSWPKIVFNEVKENETNN